jgi:hypothetical protein
MSDKKYIFKVLRILHVHFGIVINVNPLDFHFLYRWWEKGIPLELFYQIDPERIRGHRNRNLTWWIDSEINKMYQAYLQLQVGTN